MVKKEKIDNPRINCITMKQNTPFTQRRHAHILNLILNRSLSLVLSLALSLSACHPDSLDDLDGDNKREKTKNSVKLRGEKRKNR